MRPGREIEQAFSSIMADGRTAVMINGGRWSGRTGALVSHDGAMCVVDLSDDGEGYAAEVRVHARHVFKVLT